MVAFDNNIFCLALHPDAKSGVYRAKERVEFLLQTLKENGERIILPTPALAEFLIFAGGEAPQYLDALRDNSAFPVEPFDERAAIELAHVELIARRSGQKRGATPQSPWQKVKFDRQIVAIAKVNGAQRIYSMDPDIAKHAVEFGIEVLAIHDLQEPVAVQGELFGAAGTGPKARTVFSDPYRFRREPEIPR